ncbi:MAG: outer membrane beta-barrel protein [Candidatus Aminicenantes bacterium]|nr:outer membrane beta-barrel protein [Candidatus Aminicenantes bacterium]
MRRLAVLIFGCLCLAGAASAQTYQIFADEYQRLITQARWKLGPFRIFPTIDIRDVGYDDNLYFGSDQGEPKKDFTATLSPEIKVYWPLRNSFILYFRENPEYAYFHRESQQRAFNNSYGAGFRYLLLGRFVLSSEVGNAVHRRRLSSEFRIPASDRVRSLQAGFSFETARKTSIGITGAVRKISYEEIYFNPEDAPVSRLLDREEREIGAEAYYQLFSDGFLFLRGNFQEYRFLDEAALWRNSTATSLWAGLRFPLLGRMSGVLNFGFKEFNPKMEGEPPFHGLVGNSGLELRTGRLAFRLNFARDLSFSSYAEIFYYVENSVRLGGSLYLTPFLKVDYDYSSGRAEYSARESGTESEGRVDRRRNHSLGLLVRVFRTAGIGISWNFERWMSARAGFDRARNFFGLAFTRSF